MTSYQAPVGDTLFVLTELLRIGDHASLPGFEDLSRETVGDILRQAGAFAGQVLHPLNQAGDAVGCVRATDGSVRTPPGFAEAYRALVDGGWPALGGPAEYGGLGMPDVLTAACYEYLWAANCSFTMYASSLGHARILLRHGDERLRGTYVPKLVSGQWTGAMGLTEPQAGSDLGLVRTRALPRADGTYGITGTKVFTSGGEHDLAENIVHFVLARLDGAPAGTRGLSLFVAPKYLPDASGRPGKRNAVSCGSVEHKMGLRGSATCQMNYDDATGFLVGEPNRGLAAMFVLMNHTRLVTATQALGLSEIAYQNAAAYARARLQGRAPAGPRYPDQTADPIIVQPDVRRMLLGIRSFNEAARALVLWASLQSDLAERSPEPEQRVSAANRLALLTPVLKAMVSESAFDNAVAAQHLHGGYGYVSETGVDQFVRDVRVSAIGEGVTAVQAMDLVRRKLPLDDGAVIAGFLQEVRHAAEDRGTAMEAYARPLEQALADLEAATEWVARRADDPTAQAAAAVHYLHLLGRVALGWIWVLTARRVSALTARGEAPHALQAKLALARFYLENLPAETSRRLSYIQTGPAAIMELPDSWF